MPIANPKLDGVRAFPAPRISGYSARALAKVTPHRTHDSNWLKSLLCRLGFHHWHYIKLRDLPPRRELAVCHWCPEVKICRRTKLD